MRTILVPLTFFVALSIMLARDRVAYAETPACSPAVVAEVLDGVDDESTSDAVKPLLALPQACLIRSLSAVLHEQRSWRAIMAVKQLPAKSILTPAILDGVLTTLVYGSIDSGAPDLEAAAERYIATPWGCAAIGRLLVNPDATGNARETAIRLLARAGANADSELGRLADVAYTDDDEHTRTLASTALAKLLASAHHANATIIIHRNKQVKP